MKFMKTQNVMTLAECLYCFFDWVPEYKGTIDRIDSENDWTLYLDGAENPYLLINDTIYPTDDIECAMRDWYDFD